MVRLRRWQSALGTFIATFARSILVLREVREKPGHSFVPGLSTYVSIRIVWLSLAMIVVYINHISQRIRAESIIETAEMATAKTLRTVAGERRMVLGHYRAQIDAAFDDSAERKAARRLPAAPYLKSNHVRMHERVESFLVSGARLARIAPDQRFRSCTPRTTDPIRAARDRMLHNVLQTWRPMSSFSRKSPSR